MIICDDVIKFCDNYKGEKFHALICDPPYHLIGKSYQKSDWKADQSTPYGRAKLGKRGGFMGKEWDGGDIAFQTETWKTFANIMHDGAFGMAFSSTRTLHRMMVAIEDAGLILHPVIFLWGFGSGFPKATRIDDKVDRLLGKEGDRKVVGKGASQPAKSGHFGGLTGENINYSEEGERYCPDITEPATEEAKAWVGHRYGLQALKPACEPVIIFQKPYKGKPIDNMMQTGAGALNIDDCRIEHDEKQKFTNRKQRSAGWNTETCGFDSTKNTTASANPDGRWPANLIVVGEEAKKILDDQSGICGAFAPVKSGQNGTSTGIYHDYKDKGDDGRTFYGEREYGASRFFHYVDDQIDSSDPIYYCAKASRGEREAGLEGIEEKSFGENKEKKIKNSHPTVKPIKLIEYLSKLLLPPDKYSPRRIFVPFAGVGSEIIGCMNSSWEEIVGVEKESEYVKIAEARIKYWKNKFEKKESGVKLNVEQMELGL